MSSLPWPVSAGPDAMSANAKSGNAKSANATSGPLIRHRRLVTLVFHDLRSQWRYGIHAAYGVVLAFYLAVILFAGNILPPVVLAFIILSDPSVVGFFFLGGLMLLERSERTRTALAITPVSAGDYLAAKLMSLTLLALGAVILMALATPLPINWPLLILAVLAASLHFTGIGAGLANRFKTVTGYFMGSAGIIIPMVLPGLVALLDPMPIALAIIPFASMLRLLMLAFGAIDATMVETLSYLASATLWAAMAVAWGHRQLQREFGRK